MNQRANKHSLSTVGDLKSRNASWTIRAAQARQVLVWGQDSGAFNLEDSGLRDAESLERLLLVLGVTMLLLVSEGTQVVTNGLRRTVDAHWSRGLSYLKIGLRWVRRAVAVGTAIFERIALVGGVDPEPLGFRKRSGVTAAKAIAGLRGRTFAFRRFS